MKKIIVILGPTATGKSDLAVEIAQKINGEIISADSRQVYTGLDIGTGKITKKEMHGISHHLLDAVSPKKTFTVVDWKKQAEKVIAEIIDRGHTPIIVGGTGFYIQAIVDNIIMPEVKADQKLRKVLSEKSTEELFTMLQKIDPKRAKTIDRHNPVRLIRAIEIGQTLGNVPKLKKQKSKYEFKLIGLTAHTEILKDRIHTRLLKRLKKGMIQEAENLHVNGLSFKRMRELGLEYRYLADYLEKKISKEALIQKLDTEIYQYAKRQMTWFKRDKRIQWIDIDGKNWGGESEGIY